MIKTSAMCSAHTIHVLVRNTLIICVVLLLALFVWLKIGIHIKSIEVAKYHIDGLYIKLDKKLILKADKVIIPKRKAKPSFHKIHKTLESVKYVLTFFEHITLKDIHFDNNILGINFHDNILQLSSKDYLIRGNIHREGKMLIGSIPMLRLKKHNIIMRGEFSYDLDDDILATEGKFLFSEISGYFRARKVEDKINFSFNSDTFEDLKSIVDTIDMPKNIKVWIAEKIKAQNYKVRTLTGKGDIVNKQFQLDVETLQANILLSNVTIDFKEGIAPVLSPSVVIEYSNTHGLVFDLDNPSYLGKNLEGSKVSIVNLRDDNVTLNLNLKFDTRFDENIQKILYAYHVNIPVLQKSGTVNAVLDMQIGLKESFFHSVIDVEFAKGKVAIKDMMFPIENGKLHFENDFVTLKDLLLSDPAYEGTLSGTIDVKKNEADFIFEAKRVLLKKGEKILINLENETIPFRLSYTKDLKIKIPKFTLDLKYDNDKTVLNISNLYRIKKYISDHIPIEEGGSLNITTKDFEAYSFKGVLKRNSCFLYESNNICATRVDFHGIADKKNVNFYAFNDRLHYNKAKGRINIKNINIDLEQFLAQGKKTNSKKKKKKAKNLVIVGKNSHLRYDKYSLITDSYDVEVKPNGNIKAIGSTDGDIVKFTKVNDKLTLQALRIKDKVLHPLINFDGLQKGRYSIHNSGNPAKVMKGEIIVEGGVMRDFKAYNNTLAFINTLPALATLQKPGYSEEGFTVTQGIIEYRMINRTKIIFDSIYIKGDSATIIGKGEIDLNKKSINIELGIQVARELGKLVGSIPLVGYILVGDSKSITVGLQITGSLDKPIVNVSAAKDILSYPLELIKRTIEAPGKLFTPTTQ